MTFTHIRFQNKWLICKQIDFSVLVFCEESNCKVAEMFNLIQKITQRNKTKNWN